MLNLKLILRNLFKKKSYTILNIVGLAIGFSCSFAVIGWVKNELSYDKHLPDSDRIYRLTLETVTSGNRLHFARCWVQWIQQLPGVFPQIEELVRLEPYRHTAVKADENKFYSDKIFATDSNFFKVFGIDLLYGDAESILNDPYSMVISSSFANKCFGNTNPIGKTILLSGEYETDWTSLNIKGVMKDSPLNSHIHFDAITSFVDPQVAPGWAYVYLLLNKGVSPEDILTGLPEFIKKQGTVLLQMILFFSGTLIMEVMEERGHLLVRKTGRDMLKNYPFTVKKMGSLILLQKTEIGFRFLK